MITEFNYLEDSGIERPERELVTSQPVEVAITQAAQVAAVIDAITTSGGGTAPAPLTTVTATESPVKVQGRTISLVSVSYTGATPGVRIWFTGYKGNPNPALVGEGNASPVDILCETTAENVVVTAQSVSGDGTPSDFASAPTTTVLLDGVISAPPAPTATALISTPYGFQFSFTQLAAQSADVIDSYRVYRASVGNFNNASLIQTIKHSPNNLGNVVVQDQMEQYQTRWYWLTSINTSGLESNPGTFVGSGVSGAVATGGSGDNLIYNGDFSIFTAPTGVAGTLQSAARRTSDGDMPNGWTRDFQSNGAGDGVAYRAAASGTMPSNGQYLMVMQDATAGGNCQYSIVSDAFPVIANTAYYGSAFFGFNTGIPAGGAWYFRIVFYAQNTTDFSGASPSRLSDYDIVNNSTSSATGRRAGAFKTPANCGYVRFVFFHWGNTTSMWNMLIADVRCTTLLSSQQQASVANSYTFTAAGILTQSGTSTTINVAASTGQFGFGQVSYNSGSVNPGGYGAYYIYCNDPAYNGGAVTYLATTAFINVNGVEGVIYFGKITTAAGGGGTGGGGSGGTGGCFSGDVEIKTPDGYRRFDSLPRDKQFFVNTLLGVRLAHLLVHENYSCDMIDMGGGKLVTLTHDIKHDGGWRPASEHFKGCPIAPFHGTVYNLHVCDTNPDTHHYILASGEVAHNMPVK